MIKGIGVDIVDVRRITALLGRYGESFVNRVLGPTELSMFTDRTDRPSFLAGRFAAKEAVIKSLAGMLPHRPPYGEIQIVTGTADQPTVKLSERYSDLTKRISFLVSISHEKNYAVAMAMVQENE